MISDITERKNAEKELSQFKTTLDMTLDCVFMFAPDTLKFFYVNNGAVDQIGYSREEMLEMTPLDIKPEFDEESFRERLEQLISGVMSSLTFETVHEHKNGSLIPVEIFLQYVSPPGESGRFVAIVRDITARKLEENALHRLVEGFSASSGEEFFRALVLLMTESMDMDYAFVGELTGEQKNKIQTIAVSVKGEIGENFEYSLKDTPCDTMIRSNLCHFDNVQERFPKDAMLKDMGIESYIGAPLFDSHDNILGLIVVLRTKKLQNLNFNKSMLRLFAVRASAEMERTIAEDALRKSQKNLARAQKIASLGSWDWNISTGGFHWSDEVYRIFGADPQKAVPAYEVFMNSIHPEERDAVKKALNEAISNKKPLSMEHRILWPDGTEKMVHEHAEVVFDNAGKAVGMLGTVQDITERKQNEESLQHTQKLESLGVLAGGIAHDFNNILVGIMGNANLAVDELPPGSRAREYVEDVITAAKRAADLARQMLAYSGRGKFIVEPINLSGVVEEMIHLLEVGMDKNVSIIYRLDENPIFIEADATQIRQVVMNLVMNASEAIGGKNGEVTLSTGSMDVTTGYLDGTFLDDDLLKGRYVYLEVSDNGCGMDNETKEKIFDPFFTTKLTGRGLGLAAVMGIVCGHKGALKVYSEPGKGTTFKIIFPSSELPAKPERNENETLENWKGYGTALIVDDEEAILKVGRRMLEKAGFNVLTARDGEEGLNIYKGKSDEINFVLLDVTMPRMDGETTFREMRQINPGVCVILSSGYNEQDAIQKFAGHGLAGFVQKPYTYLGLLSKVKEATQISG